MGILGRYPKEEIAAMVKETAAQYDQVNGKDGAIPAFYIIYGTCWPGGEIGYLDDATLIDYIKYAQSEGMLVFIDHQIGKYSVLEAMEKILPYLEYPNVHLAIDPEWRTLSPMKEIGSITAKELNEAQDYMDEYIRQHDIAGIRMLVVHQFADRMIQTRQSVVSHRDRVILIHTADGFGSPEMKKATYQRNAVALNIFSSRISLRRVSTCRSCRPLRSCSLIRGRVSSCISDREALKFGFRCDRLKLKPFG